MNPLRLRINLSVHTPSSSKNYLMKCYYEELELHSAATTEEITKAYKKFALKYHPDKNVGNAEEARNKFLDIQKAYKVLSDPHERAWYDRNKDALEVEELSGNFVNPSSYHNTYAFKNYDDSVDGFYTVYRELFQTIVTEELLFDKTKTEADYPVFGYSDSNFESVVKPFYLRWSIFQTKKTFSWTDEISESEGVNRQEVRYIKKLNSKNRTLQVKQYNESVRALVLFLKKRDKRIPKKTPAPKTTNTNPTNKPPPSVRRPPIDVDWQAHYQNILGDLDEIDNQIDEFVVNSHKQKANRDFDGIDDEEIKSTLEQHSAFVFKDELDESIVKCIKCILCDKDFKTLAMFLSHIKSKKHLSIVRACERAKKRQKYLDDKFFTPPTSDSCDKMGEDKHLQEDSIDVDDTVEQVQVDEEIDHDVIQQHFETIKLDSPDDEIALDKMEIDQIITKEDLNKAKRKNKSKKKKPLQPSTTAPKNEQSRTSVAVDCSDVRNGSEGKKDEFKCQICGETFQSNSKLFKHIKEKGHAALKVDAPSTKKRSKK